MKRIAACSSSLPLMCVTLQRSGNAIAHWRDGTYTNRLFLTMLNQDISCDENSVDTDQLISADQDPLYFPLNLKDMLMR